MANKILVLGKLNIVKTIGDFLYKNSLMAITAGLYIGIYAANLDKLDIWSFFHPVNSGGC